MKIEQSFTVEAPRARVSDFLLDVKQMSKCIPGVSDVTGTGNGHGHYSAVLKVRVGPIHARFNGDVDIDDTLAPDRFLARAEGRDSGSGSVAQVEFHADLIDLPDGRTRVDASSDVTLRGRLSQFGTGVIQSTATSMMKEFAECAGRSIEIGSDADRPTRETPHLARVLLRGLLDYLIGVLRRVRGLSSGSNESDQGLDEGRNL